MKTLLFLPFKKKKNFLNPTTISSYYVIFLLPVQLKKNLRSRIYLLYLILLFPFSLKLRLCLYHPTKITFLRINNDLVVAKPKNLKFNSWFKFYLIQYFIPRPHITWLASSIGHWLLILLQSSGFPPPWLPLLSVLCWLFSTPDFSMLGYLRAQSMDLFSIYTPSFVSWH